MRAPAWRPRAGGSVGPALCPALPPGLTRNHARSGPPLPCPRLRRGLLYCMEYLEENIDEWLGEQLAGYGDDDYLVFDCPGQIELYSHLSVFRTFVDYLRRDGWQVCAVSAPGAEALPEPGSGAGADQTARLPLPARLVL